MSGAPSQVIAPAIAVGTTINTLPASNPAGTTDTVALPFQGVSGGVPLPNNSVGLGYLPSGLVAVLGTFATPATVTITIAAPGVISWTGAPAIGTAIKLATTGSLPTGYVAGTVYFVSAQGWTANAVSLSTTYTNALAGISITTTGTQSPTQTAYAVQSAYLTPLAGRGFNVSLWGTFAGSTQLERSFDSGTTWLPITAAGTQLYIWTAPASEQAQEDQYAVLYRLNNTTYTSGTWNYIISQ